LKHYDRLLAEDLRYAELARVWSRKVRDVHEWLVEIGVNPPIHPMAPSRVTYHEACHLCHGQKISRAPRELLRMIPGIDLAELPEATWCCGSAGIYNITQPEMSRRLLQRKLDRIASTGATVVASANPGCCVQLEAGVRDQRMDVSIVHPVTLLARAYRGSVGHDAS
jgi:glycolate oxidase iron-sulfur subunit